MWFLLEDHLKLLFINPYRTEISGWIWFGWKFWICVFLCCTFLLCTYAHTHSAACILDQENLGLSRTCRGKRETKKLYSQPQGHAELTELPWKLCYSYTLYIPHFRVSGWPLDRILLGTGFISVWVDWVMCEFLCDMQKQRNVWEFLNQLMLK